MSGYRDDRQVLRDQLAELTRALAELRARGEARGDGRAKLRARVDESSAQLERDRRALAGPRTRGRTST